MSPIKKFLGGSVSFRVRGLPLSCLNRLRVYKVCNLRIQEDVTTFETSLVDSLAIKKLLNNFEYQATENYNLFRGVNFLLNHCVLVIAVCLAVVAFLVVDRQIYAVRVQCDDTSLIPCVYEHLAELGVEKFMPKKHLQTFDLAADLVETFDNIAHAHVQICGNTLVVNLVSADHHQRKTKNNVYAQYDAVITEVTAYSGTPLVAVGDVVKKGDLLVTDAYPDSVVITGEVAFVHGDEISRLVIWII